MKKSLIITIVIIMLVGVLSLTACGGGAPVQKMLGNSAPWISLLNQKEVSTYDVVNTNGDIVNNGTYVIEIAKYANSDVIISEDKSLSGFTGYVAKSTLTMDNGDTINSACATNQLMQVVYSSTISNIAGKTTKYIASYNKKTVDFSLTENGTSSSQGSIKHKDFNSKAYTDNNMLYLIARSLPAGLVSLEVNVPNTDTKKLDKVLINRAKLNVNVEINNVIYKASLVQMAYNRTFPGIGKPIEAYVSDDPILNKDITIGDPLATQKPILKIVEGNTVYLLKNTYITSL